MWCLQSDVLRAKLMFASSFVQERTEEIKDIKEMISKDEGGAYRWEHICQLKKIPSLQ